MEVTCVCDFFQEYNLVNIKGIQNNITPKHFEMFV